MSRVQLAGATIDALVHKIHVGERVPPAIGNTVMPTFIGSVKVVVVAGINNIRVADSNQPDTNVNGSFALWTPNISTGVDWCKVRAIADGPATIEIQWWGLNQTAVERFDVMAKVSGNQPPAPLPEPDADLE